MDKSFYNKKFIEAMNNLGYEQKDFKDFYCIGSSKTHSKIPLCYANKVEIPDLVQECICTKKIEENCWIMNINNFQVIPIGNHCVKRFLPITNQKGIRCDKCGTRHQNRLDTFCDACRIKIKVEEKSRLIDKKNQEKDKKRQAIINGTYKVHCLDCYKFNPKFPRCYNCNIIHNNTF